MNTIEKEQYSEDGEIEEFKDYLISKRNKTIHFLTGTVIEDLNQYAGDARSFGYDADSGSVHIATYKQAVGVLAEDAVALVEQHAEQVDVTERAKPEYDEFFKIGEKTQLNANCKCVYSINKDEQIYQDKNGKLIISYVVMYTRAGNDTSINYLESDTGCSSTAEATEVFLDDISDYKKEVKNRNQAYKEAIDAIDACKSAFFESEKDLKTDVNENKGKVKPSKTTHHQESRESTKVSETAKKNRNVAKFFGGKALTGSKKQKEWAEKIRKTILESASLTDEQKVDFLKVGKIVTTAKFWINNKDIMPKYFTCEYIIADANALNEMMEKHGDVLRRSGPTGPKDLARAEIRECLSNLTFQMGDWGFPNFNPYNLYGVFEK